MTYRVWCKDEFDDCRDEAQRDDIAWVVPDEVGIWDRERRYPCDDPEKAAEKYADHCHSNRDGYEWGWPQEFVVHDGKSYMLVSVDRDFDPVFTMSDPKPYPIK